MTSWKTPTDEQLRVVLSSMKKETDRQFFFSRLKNPLWLKPLVESGIFESPPEVLSNSIAPFWPEFNFLKNIYKEVPSEVVKIILGIPKTDNPQVYNGILEVALGLDGELSVKLLPKIIESTEINNKFFSLHFSNLLSYWVKGNQIKAALKLAEILGEFQPDPNANAKRKRRRKNPSDWNTHLEPYPILDKWEYKEVFENGIRPLIEKEPCQTARMLIDFTFNMIQLTKHDDELEKCGNEDLSELWCCYLDDLEEDYSDPKEILINALTYACEKVYELSPELIDNIDQLLKNQRWKVFKRLRQHLYSKNLTEKTLPWISELICQYGEYSKQAYNFEFQLMIRKACEHFGFDFISDEQFENIFNKIQSGPDEEGLCYLSEELPPKEMLEKRGFYFQYKQLRPFESILTGKYLSYYNDIKEKLEGVQLTDDDYCPMGRVKGGVVKNKSPVSVEYLENLGDAKLLEYINEWQDNHRDKDDWLTEINISSLSEAFQTVFKNTIISDENRFVFWIDNRDQIKRPVYVKMIVKAMQENIFQQPIETLEKCFEFCEWVLSHKDTERQEGELLSDESSESPDWHSSRRAVGDLVGVCANKDSNLSLEVRDSLGKLLKLLCTQFDWRLDCHKPVILNRNDQLTEAINNTRSMALESLVYFGFWVRKYSPEDELSELNEILDERLDGNAQFSLKPPEIAMLGMHYGRLYNLLKDWAIDNKDKIFKQDNLPIWAEAFGHFIRFNRPNLQFFEIFENDFEYALENLNELKSKKYLDKEIIDLIGQHLFAYYLWEVYPLQGSESLLEKLYERTSDERGYWGSLFNHVGISLSSSGDSINKALVERCKEFFDWRFKVNDPEELAKFAYWLGADCISPDWRLEKYSLILDIRGNKSREVMSELITLNSMLEENTEKVVECFAKITDFIDQNDSYYIRKEIGSKIISFGLKNDGADTQKNAERARENLLRIGRFDFLD